MSPLNLYVIVAALAVGAVAGSCWWWPPRPRHTRRPWAGVACFVGVGMVGSAIAVVVAMVATGLDLFAGFHAAYVVGTLGVPLAGALALGSARLTSMERLIATVALIPLPIGIYATHIEPFWLRVDAVALEVTGVDDGEGIRIGVLADIQSYEIGEYESSAIDRLIAENPDIVLLPGDVSMLEVDEWGEAHEGFVAALGRLAASVPHVVAVNGDVDDVEVLRALTEGSGVVVADDEVVSLDVDGTPVDILGITLRGSPSRLAAAQAAFLGRGDADSAGDSSDQPPIEPALERPIRIVLSHRPGEALDVPPHADIDLFVAGHTHGGQISLPFFGPPMTASRVPRDAAAGGLSEVNGHDLYVSTGVGRERRHAPQVRFGVRPSVGIIDLVAGADSP